MNIRKFIVPSILVFLPLFGGFLIGRGMQGATSTWYANLQKPNWNPPGWVFGLAWTGIYLMMGTASALIWSWQAELARPAGRALSIYFVQLVFNFLWTPLFFGLQRPLWALFDLTLLLSTLLVTLIRFRQIDARAARLLYPYVLWGTFAALLNLRICQLNGY